MVRFDSSDVDSFNHFFVEHVGDCSIGVHLADGARPLCPILQSIWFESKDHSLVSNVAIVTFSLSIFFEVILVCEGLSLALKHLKVHDNWDRQWHVLLEHNAARRHSMSLVTADSNSTLSRCEDSVDGMVCLFLVGDG